MTSPICTSSKSIEYLANDGAYIFTDENCDGVYRQEDNDSVTFRPFGASTGYQLLDSILNIFNGTSNKSQRISSSLWENKSTGECDKIISDNQDLNGFRYPAWIGMTPR